MTDRQPLEALLIDPNPEDVRLFLEALENEKITNSINIVSTGAKALDFLHQRGEYTDAVRPNLILMDIELPQMDGQELLEELNGDPELMHIPVIVLTGSDKAEDIVQSYDLHVNAYVQKPVEPDTFLDVVRSLEGFWLEVVRSPPEYEEEDDLL
ncbi:response regulator [Halomontanus rarus]|uniref:response regulator n=1 Tax=Halomontanus rarus TaxID=3034020 RepID=UPI00293BE62F|nr:response regulator [Halovivax sp. KZCA124]